MRPVRVALILLLLGTPRAALASEIAPAGAEFQVNTYTLSRQRSAAVAATAGGGAVVVWVDEAGNHSDVFGQRFDQIGSRIGTDFQVSGYLGGGNPAVVGTMDGGFVAAWQGMESPDTRGIFGRRYDAGGDPITQIFQIDQGTVRLPYQPELAMNRRGNLPASWTNYDGGGIYARRLASDGSQLGTEFQVHDPGGLRWSSALLALPSDDFVAVWTWTLGDGSGLGVFGRRIASSGVLLGSEFHVNSFTLGFQDAAALAALSDGGFVVSWRSYPQDGSISGIFGQRFDALASPVGSEFQVNSYTFGGQYEPSISVDPNGGFLVAWEGRGNDGDLSGVFARRLDHEALPLGVDFMVNTYTIDPQFQADVAATAVDSFVVTWTSSSDPFPETGQDGDNSGIFAQRYEPTCGNGRIDPGEEM